MNDHRVQPLQERGPEPAYCRVTHPAGHGLGTCNLDPGHDGNHSSGLANWPQARSNYRSDQLTGAKIDDLLLDLFRRVEQLEQTSAGGAAVDDMFATMNRARERLAGDLGEVEKRMTRLEQAQVYGPGPHDLSALQASIENHINRALTEFAGQLGTILDGMRDVLTQHISTNTTAVLAQLAPEPEQARCGEPDLAGLYHCEEGPGHGGRHRNGTSSWPVKCGHTSPDHAETCVLSTGHRGQHESRRRGGIYGRTTKWDDQAPNGAQTERASGSPAAVRCPERFREGQCLGYAGHDGDCSAVPGSGNEQLCDPEEFAESTEDRSSDGTPLEKF